MWHKATIVTDLSFGDAGKGTIVDALTVRRDVSAIVRFNGGGQAAHNVVRNDGVHTTFSQFGSGTLSSEHVRTHLSRFMLVDPLTLINEAEHLTRLGCRALYERLSIDEHARIVTPFHKAANRLREFARSKNAHGSCGMGIGETMSHALSFPDDVIYAKDLLDVRTLAVKLSRIQASLQETADALDTCFLPLHIEEERDLLRDADVVSFMAQDLARAVPSHVIVDGQYLKTLSQEGELIFEGAQGVLLDEWYGFHPYTTWSTTTFENALTLLKDIEYDGFVEKLGVLRAYTTRHGAGPFPTENNMLSQSVPDLHNGTGRYQGAFRVGWFDDVLARYALAVTGGVDALAITNIDRFDEIFHRTRCRAYETKEGKRLTTLPVKSEKTDLVHQEVLTKLLQEVTPVYDSVPEHSSLYLDELQSALDVPIAIESYGPRECDKQYRSFRTTQYAA